MICKVTIRSFRISTIWWATYDFLLLFHCNYVYIALFAIYFYLFPNSTLKKNTSPFYRARNTTTHVSSRTFACTVSSRFLILFFPYFFVSGPCARLSWPSCQLLSARKSTVSYRIVSICTPNLNCIVSPIPKIKYSMYYPVYVYLRGWLPLQVWLFVQLFSSSVISVNWNWNRKKNWKNESVNWN